MTSKLYVHVPLLQLGARLPLLTAKRLQPEIACHEINLDQLDLSELSDYAAELHSHDLGTTLHAPFSGFCCGHSRHKVTDQSKRIVEQTLELAQLMNACRIVYHPGLPAGSSDNQAQQWLERSIPFWQHYLPQAQQQQTVLCLENIWETRFDYQLALLQEIDSEWFGHVFDIGHYHLFSEQSLAAWLTHIGPFIRHLHIHDNHGHCDDHLVLGDGDAPLNELYQWLINRPEIPTVTLENRHLEQSLLSLQHLQKHQPDLLSRLNN